MSRMYLLCATALLMNATGARAETALPYSTRTRPYSGWSGTVRGDIRTIGMAGAMVGLADTFIASTDNPAGLAMTLKNVTVQYAGNKLRDGYLQDFDQSIGSSNIGIAGASYPWGFSVGWWTPANEGQLYSVQGSGERVEPAIKVREFRFSAARLLLDDRLSAGASFILGQSVHSLTFPDGQHADTSMRSYDVSASFGLLWRTERRILLGSSYGPPMLFRADPATNPTNGIPGFNQPIKTPWHLSVGVGWLPNRIFRAGAGLYVIGKTEGAAVLADDNRLSGQSDTYQPRLGANYTWADFRDFKSDIATGLYLESSRTAGRPIRLHFTAGLSLDIWVLNLGWGIDRSPRYVNYIYTAAVDLVRIMRKLDLIPDAWRPPQAGLFYPPFRDSDEGLPRPLVRHWVKRPGSDIFEIGAELPKRIEEKFKEIGTAIDSIGGEPEQPEVQKATPPKGAEPKAKPPLKRKPQKKPKPSPRPSPRPRR